MTNKTKLKIHTPISSWKNLHDHVSVGDIVYVTMPIESETIRFRMEKNKLKLELDEASQMNREELSNICYDLLEKDDWSNQFIGYAYQKDDSLVLYAIYDLTFQVYLDGITVQKIADAFGFKPHPIVFHGSVKPSENESVSDFLVRVVSESRRVSFNKKEAHEKVVVENVSRLYEYRRIIGAWSFVTQEKIKGNKEVKQYILSI
jgi:hypothetical protein